MGKYTPKLPKAVIEYEVRDKNGKLIDKGKFPAKSWVGNIVGLLSAIFSSWASSSTGYSASSRADLIDTSGTARSLGFGAVGTGRTFGACAPAGETTAGIVVGASDTPVSIGQYALISQIGHGTGSGQLQYQASTVDPLSKNATWFFRIIRTFTNGSGATVTIREIGLYVKLGTNGETCMFARDVPTSPINVPNGSTLTVRYIISHSLS
jgi:hypothetical protein